VEFRVLAGENAPRTLRAPATDDRRLLVIAVATDQNVANLPPILQATRPGDEVIWLCSTPALRERAVWATAVLRDLGLKSSALPGDCPTRATDVPSWVDANLRPRIDGSRRVAFIGNGGLKPMSRSLEQSLDDLLDEVLYGEVPTPTIVRSPADRRQPTRIEACRRPVRLPDLLGFSGHALADVPSDCRLLWEDGVRRPDASRSTRYGDLDEISKDYVRYLRMQRRERIDPDRLRLNDVKALSAESAEVARHLADWERTVDDALRRAMADIRSVSMARQLEADAPDLERIESAFAELAAMGGDVRKACEEAGGLCQRVRRTGELDDDAAGRMLELHRRAARAAAARIAHDLRVGQGPQDRIFVAASRMLRATELALQHPQDDAAARILGPEFEAAVVGRVLDRLDERPPWAAAVGEVWSGVKVVHTARPAMIVAEYDVLLVLKNALMINIECKAGTVQRKDLDARVAVQGRAASSLAEMWLCSILPTGKAGEDWFRSAHGVRQAGLADRVRHLPYTWPGQPLAYELDGVRYECPQFVDVLDECMSRFVPPSH
jgi:hypothetical protein